MIRNQLKVFSSAFFGICLLTGCNPEPDALSIISRSNEAHGTAALLDKTFAFEFRNIQYTTSRNSKGFTYTRTFQDSLGNPVVDSLVNSIDFSRSVNGSKISVEPQWETKYANALNSVLYFFQLPLPLSDPAVIANYNGETQINGVPYYTLSIRFQETEGGEDYDDEYLYWINKKNFLIDFLAYNYHTEGGGVRFRQAINRRSFAGLVIQDYINYRPIDKSTPLEMLPGQFEQNQLIELSQILNLNVHLE